MYYTYVNHKATNISQTNQLERLVYLNFKLLLNHTCIYRQYSENEP